MTNAKITFAIVALCAATIVLGAAALASAQPVQQPPMIGPNGQPQASFGLFAANQPASSNRVGIFVARKLNGISALYYCSSPVDANSNEPNGCKQIKGFPLK